MYLYLGQDTVVNTNNIIGIFDLDNTTSTNRITKDYLAKAQKNGQIREVSTEIPKSFVLCQEGEKTVVYLSQIATTTLRKRWGYFRDLSVL